VGAQTWNKCYETKQIVRSIASLCNFRSWRSRGLRHWFGGGITDRVTRLSPCPVLSITQPLPSHPWRGKLAPLFFGLPKQRSVEI